jgi:hypothetical protein
MSEQAYWVKAQTEADQGTEQSDRGSERFPLLDEISPCAKCVARFAIEIHNSFERSVNIHRESNKFRALIGYSSGMEDITSIIRPWRSWENVQTSVLECCRLGVRVSMAELQTE